MAKYRMVKRTYTFQGRNEAGHCVCPVCRSTAEIHPYKMGEKWATLICPQCGWFQVPTMHAHPGTQFDVQVREIVEVQPRGTK